LLTASEKPCLWSIYQQRCATYLIRATRVSPGAICTGVFLYCMVYASFSLQTTSFLVLLSCKRKSTMNAQTSSGLFFFGLMRKHPRLTRLFSTCLILLMLLPYPQQIRAMAGLVADEQMEMTEVAEQDASHAKEVDNRGASHAKEVDNRGASHAKEANNRNASHAKEANNRGASHAKEAGSTKQTAHHEAKQKPRQAISAGSDCCDDTASETTSPKVATHSEGTSNSEDLYIHNKIEQTPSVSDHACCEPTRSVMMCDMPGMQKNEGAHQDPAQVPMASSHCNGASLCQCTHDEVQPPISVLPLPVVQGDLKITSYDHQPFFSLLQQEHASG